MIPLAKPDLSGNESKYVGEVLASGRLAMGDFISRFEQQFRDYLGVKNAIACSSGTMGLYICLRALRHWFPPKSKWQDRDAPPEINGILPQSTQTALSGSNYHVLTANETFAATMNAIRMAGYYCSPISSLPAMEETAMVREACHPYRWILERRNPNIGWPEVYMPCHIFGEADPDFHTERCWLWAMIEDACEALGAKHEGEYLGTFGLAGVFGFYPNKQITTGEGGMIVTDDDSFAKQCRIWINQGRDGTGPHEQFGTNARMTEMQAAIGVAQMERIDEILEKRRTVAQIYMDNLNANALAKRGIEVPEQRDSWFAYFFKGQKETLMALQAYLSIHDINSRIYFPRMTASLYDKWLWEQKLIVPFFTQMTEDEVGAVVKAVNGWA